MKLIEKNWQKSFNGLVFLIPAFAMVLPGGVQIPFGLLIITSLIYLVLNARQLSLSKVDVWVIAGLLLYPIAISLNMLFHGEWLWNYFDNPSRFILAAIVYVALRQFELSAKLFAYSVIVGAILAMSIALLDKLNYGWDYRSRGDFLAISFGNMSLVLGLISLLTWRQFANDGLILRILPWVGFFCGLFASFASGSRGGWVALLFVFFIMSYSLPLTYQRWKSLVFIFVGLLGLILYWSSSFVQNRIDLAIYESMCYFDSHCKSGLGSVGLRLEMWYAGWLMWLDSPWIGYGVQSIEPQLLRLAENQMMAPMPPFDHLHNEYMDILAKQGVVGLTLLLGFYAFFIHFFRKIYVRSLQKKNSDIALMGIVLMACYIDFSFTQSMLSHSSTISFLAIILVLILTLSIQKGCSNDSH